MFEIYVKKIKAVFLKLFGTLPTTQSAAQLCLSYAEKCTDLNESHAAPDILHTDALV